MAKRRSANVCSSGNWLAWLTLLAGVLFLLQDLGTWAFWGLNWYTVAFLLVGLKNLQCCM